MNCPWCQLRYRSKYQTFVYVKKCGNPSRLYYLLGRITYPWGPKTHSSGAWEENRSWWTETKIKMASKGRVLGGAYGVLQRHVQVCVYTSPPPKKKATREGFYDVEVTVGCSCWHMFAACSFLNCDFYVRRADCLAFLTPVHNPAVSNTEWQHLESYHWAQLPQSQFSGCRKSVIEYPCFNQSLLRMEETSGGKEACKPPELCFLKASRLALLTQTEL